MIRKLKYIGLFLLIVTIWSLLYTSSIRIAFELKDWYWYIPNFIVGILAANYCTNKYNRTEQK